MKVYKRKPNVACDICGKKIYKRPSEVKRNKGNVYCSQNCYGKSCRKEKPCLVCGNLILARYNKKTCSRGCANKHRTGINYKTGRPTKDKVVSLQALKRRLIQERGISCEQCNYNKTGILQIHHIDRNRNNNHLSNLKLLCPNCHFEEHYLDKESVKT